MIVSFFVLTACGQEASVQPAISRIEAIADNYLEEMLQRYPSTATYYSLPGMRHDDLFDNLSDALLAEQELGDKFDIREFHNRVLENGSVTLPMLEEAVVTWILRVNSV